MQLHFPLLSILPAMFTYPASTNMQIHAFFTFDIVELDFCVESFYNNTRTLCSAVHIFNPKLVLFLAVSTSQNCLDRFNFMGQFERFRIQWKWAYIRETSVLSRQLIWKWFHIKAQCTMVIYNSYMWYSYVLLRVIIILVINPLLCHFQNE